jgi:hypothetical protein
MTSQPFSEHVARHTDDALPEGWSEDTFGGDISLFDQRGWLVIRFDPKRNRQFEIHQQFFSAAELRAIAAWAERKMKETSHDA